MRAKDKLHTSSTAASQNCLTKWSFLLKVLTKKGNGTKHGHLPKKSQQTFQTNLCTSFSTSTVIPYEQTRILLQGQSHGQKCPNLLFHLPLNPLPVHPISCCLLPGQHSRALCSPLKLQILQTADPTPTTENKAQNAWKRQSRNHYISFSFPYPPLLINISSGKRLLGSSVTTRPTSEKMRIHVLPWLTSSGAVGVQ